MRAFALGLIILSDIIIGLTNGMNLNPAGLSFLLTMILVVIVAFTVSALLRNMQSLTMTRNYTISGIAGVVTGAIFFFWIKSNTEALITWFEDHGLTILLVINILAALVIFFVKPAKKKETTAQTA